MITKQHIHNRERIYRDKPLPARVLVRSLRSVRHVPRMQRILSITLIALLLVVGCAPSVGSAATPTPELATANATRTEATGTGTTDTELISEPDEGSCSVRVQGLNLRRGPGTAYTPALASLNSGAALRSIARNTDSTWVQVVVVSTGRQGWVAAGAQYINCTTPVRDLPVATNIPALPSPAATATRTSAPTPTRTAPAPTPIAFVILPPGPGGGPNDLTGDLVAGEDDVRVYVNEFGSTIMSFSNRMWLRMEVDSVPDDTEIREVQFTFTADSDLTEVHRQVETTAGYCSFGGGEPNCNALELRPGAVWPGTGIEITNGFYLFSARVTVENEDEGTDSSRSWGGIIEIDNDALPPDPGREEEGGTTIPEEGEEDLVINLLETAPGTTSDFIADALAFRVEAYDPSVGSDDGDGIDTVLLQVFDSNGTLVHERTEGTAGYCAFSGGEPDCVPYDFDDNGYTWPSGDEIFTDADYMLSAFVTADDGRTTSADWFITIE